MKAKMCFFGFDLSLLRKEKKAAFLGYLSMDVAHPPDDAV